MFKCVEVTEQFYKVVTPYKITNREEANPISHGSKQNLVQATLPTNPDKGRYGKRKKHYAGRPRNQ